MEVGRKGGVGGGGRGARCGRCTGGCTVGRSCAGRHRAACMCTRACGPNHLGNPWAVGRCPHLPTCARPHPLAHAGVMASTVDSGQQWDAPNVWPPLQHMVVEGVARSGAQGAAALAQQMAGERAVLHGGGGWLHWLRAALWPAQQRGWRRCAPGQRTHPWSMVGRAHVCADAGAGARRRVAEQLLAGVLQERARAREGQRARARGARGGRRVQPAGARARVQLCVQVWAGK